MGLRGMVVKLLGIYDAIVVHARNGSNHTALDYAALNGHMEVVRLLAPIRISSSDVPDGTTEQYLGTALVQSVLAPKFNPEMSKYLIAEGADVNFHHYSTNFYHTAWTPLYHAAGITPCDAVGTNLERVNLRDLLRG
ncbi:hypothetical protein K438DRAFT_1843979 [Mycena galopus ATCC 62051]|nr:hypothetical protein K438DRAFT_1843979 [Mycena galopus ATCC 62051]